MMIVNFSTCKDQRHQSFSRQNCCIHNSHPTSSHFTNNHCCTWKQLVRTFVAIRAVLHPFAGRTRQRRFHSFHCTQGRTATCRTTRPVPTTALPQCRRFPDDYGRQSSTGPCRCRRRPCCCYGRSSPGSCAL